MTFDEMLSEVLELLQRDGRVSYRALKRRFALDEDSLDDLKAEILQAKRLAVDEDGAVLVWTGGAAPAPVLASAPARAPLTYTPAHLLGIYDQVGRLEKGKVPIIPKAEKANR